MEEELILPNIIVLSRPNDSWNDEPTSKKQELRAGRWTKTKYICSRADRCSRSETCRHAKPHNEQRACRSSWAYAATNSEFIHLIGYTYACANCVSILEARKFIPDRRVKLMRGETEGKVICPAAITTCVGSCTHAEPHAKNKFCKDHFKQEGTIQLTCRPASAYKRQLLFDGYALVCHRKEPNG